MQAKFFLKNLTDRTTYNLSMAMQPADKPFLQKHQEAMDAVVAQRLAVPGLDAYAIRPERLQATKWDGGARVQRFAEGLKRNVTLVPFWRQEKVTGIKLEGVDAAKPRGFFDDLEIDHKVFKPIY